jgi:DNA segregation ATPase FtsK/SpoIIIE-like protein
MSEQPEYLKRPPRIQPDLPQEEISIPPPPRQDEQSQPLWQALVPLVTIIGYIIVSATGRGSNIAFLIPMALAVVLSSVLAGYNAFRNWQIRIRKRKAYQRRLLTMRREMLEKHEEQRRFYNYNYPAVQAVLQIDGNRKDNRSGSRLWERRSADFDFGHVRLGIGSRPSNVVYVAPDNKEDNDENPLASEAERLAEDSKYLSDIPITLPLYQQPGRDTEREDVELAKNAIGIVGKSSEQVYGFVRSLVTNYMAFHSPIDAQLYVLGLNENAEHWTWLYNAPHTMINPNRGYTRIYFEDIEFIAAPFEGRLVQVHVQVGDLIQPGDVIAELVSDDGRQRQQLKARHFGRVNDIAQEAQRTKEVWREVKQQQKQNPHPTDFPQVNVGRLIVRTEPIETSKQIIKEEHDNYEMQQLRGRDRRRENAGVPRFWKERIWRELDRRERRLRDRESEGGALSLPLMLIVVDLMAPDGLYESKMANSWLEEAEGEAALSLILQNGRELGASIIFLVPDRSLVPGGCNSVVELKRSNTSQDLAFLYAETGLNSRRYVGQADVINDVDRLQQFTAALAHWRVRQSYGADIPGSVDLLQMFGSETISALELERRWQESMDPERADWPKMPIGMLPGREPRDLHFFADADGVHGMIAGSTGSGKSELLMTFILSLAIRYDPSVVNFVLIDYKGGAAFDPFVNLPHKVDLVTNLGESGVARMFAAITAELNRRQEINQRTNMKDIVRYRREGLHQRHDDNYPHLFIVIDEFAEMISNNKEYQAQLDSITRLGRALGVSLILAAQRPKGVTDQMQANIKFRICLRVETPDESRELLQRPDASYLPSIPGRGYLKVGSESLENIQIAYTGAPYNDYGDYDPLEHYEGVPIIWEDDLDSEVEVATFDVMVQRMAKLARERHGDQPKWRKPWPNPLPEKLYLNHGDNIEFEYLSRSDREFLDASNRLPRPMLCSDVDGWLDGSVTNWQNFDDHGWDVYATKAIIGLIDVPFQARLQLLKVELWRAHHVIFGAAGWGKSVCLRTLVAALTATHSPADLHLYFMDFGNLMLRVFEPLPHTGAYIRSIEQERVERLLRLLDQIVEERKEILSRANAENLYAYNSDVVRARDVGATSIMMDTLPSILVIIDNFAEFRDSYEDQIGLLTSLLRDGLSVGVHFVITAEQISVVSKQYNLLPERITLKLSDESEYANVVGRGAPPIEDIPGRGYRRVERDPLEIQVAQPVYVSDVERDQQIDENDKLNQLVHNMSNSEWQWQNNRQKPLGIEILEPYITTEDVASLNGRAMPGSIRVQIGIDDFDLLPEYVGFDQKPHFVVSGAPSSGKTTALYTWILTVTEHYSPGEVAIVIIDPENLLGDYGSETMHLSQLPHVLGSVIHTPAEFDEFLQQLKYEYAQPERPAHDLHVIIDNYDFIDEVTDEEGFNKQKLSRLANLARRNSRNGLHFVVCGSAEGVKQQDSLLKTVGSARYGLVLDTEIASSAPFYADIPRAYQQMELPRGRGFIVSPGSVTLVQVAIPYRHEENKIEYLDYHISKIQSRWSGQKASWAYPIPREQDELAPANAATETTTQPTQKFSDEQKECLKRKLADKRGKTLQEIEDLLDILSQAMSYEQALLVQLDSFGISPDSCD